MRSEPDNTSSPARLRLGFDGGQATRLVVPEEPLRVAGTSDVTYSNKICELDVLGLSQPRLRQPSKAEEWAMEFGIFNLMGSRTPGKADGGSFCRGRGADAAR